ncbi:MAG: hypothetical protein IPH73_04070 [Rhodocyclales bacterium]|nr:hypothetical protein [Rhodocyclales bacterium]
MIRRHFLKSLAVIGSTLLFPPLAFIANRTRLETLRRDVAALSVDDDYRAVLDRGIGWYGKDITSRPLYKRGSGYSDLEVLEKTMRRNPWDRAMMGWFGIDVGRKL